MKKVLLSAAVLLSSAAYVLYLGVGGGAAPTVAASSPPPAPVTHVPTPTPTSPPIPEQTPTPTPAPTPTPTHKPKGQYKDGTYKGSVADAYYGLVQVEAVISGGKLTNVTFLQYPSDRSTSRYINGQAMPYLTQEALQAQSARVDIISGATDTSLAFEQSLGDALAGAKS